MKTAKIIVKYFFILILVSVFALIFTRIYIFGYYPKAMKSFLWNDAVASALDTDTKGEIFTYNPPTAYDHPESSNFFCDHIMIVPKAGQLQITVRANKSLMPKLQSLFTWESVPDYFDAGFHFVLVDDNDNHYPLTFKKQDAAYMYYYERLVFDHLPFDEMEYLFLDIYLGENPDYSEKPFTTLYVYDKRVPKKEYKLSAAERTIDPNT